MVQSTLPEFYKTLSELDDTRAEIALAGWHSNLRTQEATLWRPVETPIHNPPPYSMRSAARTAPGYDSVQLTETLPQNEAEIASAILALSLNRLTEDLIRESNCEVTSSLVGPAEDCGSGTSDIGLRRPRAMDRVGWDNVEKFVLKVKLLSPDVRVRSRVADAAGLDGPAPLRSRRSRGLQTLSQR